MEIVAVSFELVSVLIVCGVCLSLDACEVRLPRERRMFRKLISHIWIYIWYSECYVIVLGVAFFVQGVCVV